MGLGDREGAELSRLVHEAAWRLPEHEGPEDLGNRTGGGVYFFFEEGELTADERPRIVRVGATDSFGRRIGYHYGQHRTVSVFRRHLGAAILRRSGAPGEAVRRWQRQQAEISDRKLGW